MRKTWLQYIGPCEIQRCMRSQIRNKFLFWSICIGRLSNMQIIQLYHKLPYLWSNVHVQCTTYQQSMCILKWVLQTIKWWLFLFFAALNTHFSSFELKTRLVEDTLYIYFRSISLTPFCFSFLVDAWVPLYLFKNILSHLFSKSLGPYKWFLLHFILTAVLS